MPRGRLFAIFGLPLLATLLAAQTVPVPPKPAAKSAAMPAHKPAVALPPKKPVALTAEQKKIEAQQKKAEAEAQKKAAAEQKKIEAEQKKAEAAAAAAEKKAAAAAAAQQKKAEAAAAAQQKKAATAAQPKKPASPAQSKSTQAKKPEPKTYDFSDYFRVWGVSGDTTRAEIVKRFGEPQRVGDWASKPFYYFNGTLTFFFTGDDTVGTMIVGNSLEPIPPNSIPPEVLAKAFIGRTRDDVLKALGPANSVSSDNYRYWPKTGVYKVEFQCYDFKRHVCEQMLVQF